MFRRIALAIFFVLIAVPPASAASFGISTGSSALSPSNDGNYTIPVTACQNGTCITQNVVVPVVPVPQTPSITVNGFGNGAQVIASASMTVAAANGPGNPHDRIAVCNTNTGSPSNATCEGAGYSWDYLNCTQTAPAIGSASASCSLAAPSVAGNYVAQFLSNGTYTSLANSTFTVTGVQAFSMTLNGSSSSQTVAPGASMVVVVVGGPGKAKDNFQVCRSATGCQGFPGEYLNCTGSPPSSPYPTATPAGGCTMVAPSTVASDYHLYFLENDGVSGSTVLADIPFAVSGGGGGTPTITNVTVSPNTFTAPGNFSGTLTATCSVSPCPGAATFSLSSGTTPSISAISTSPSSVAAGTAYSGTLSPTCSTTCPGSASYTLDTTAGHCSQTNTLGAAVSGSTLTFPSQGGAGTDYACLDVAMTGVSNSGSPFLAIVTVTGGSGGGGAGCQDVSAVSSVIPSNFSCDPALSADFDRVSSLPSIVSTFFYSGNIGSCATTVNQVPFTFDSQGMHGGLSLVSGSTYNETPYGDMYTGGYANYAIEYVRNMGPTHGNGNPDFWSYGQDGSTLAQNGHPELDGTPAQANNDFNEFGTADLQLQDGSNDIVWASTEYSMCPPSGGTACLFDGNPHTVDKIRNNGVTSVYLDGQLVFSLASPYPVFTASRDYFAWSPGGGNCVQDQWTMKYIHVFH